MPRAKHTPRVHPGFWALALLIALAGGYAVGYDTGYQKATRAAISSFEDCKAAGYPIQESYPEVCSGPNGKSFPNPAQSL